MTRRVHRLFVAALCVLAPSLLAAAETPENVARKTDELLDRELFGAAPHATAARADDATFLRRVFLDLAGELPTADDVVAFLLDTAPDKRQRIVESLLDDPAFGRTWGAYWRDVIMYRRSEDRALAGAAALEQFLVDSLNQNTSWDAVATAMITASGDIQENGATGLIMAQSGLPEESVAEISRIFMGIQIQCAQCHDHPTDRWKREQFHELAAFFPRVAIRPVQNGEQRSFAVVVNDAPRMLRRGNNNNRYQGSPEHYMPDLEDPSSRGTLMQPKFFVSDETVAMGARDAARRGRLAEMITSPENDWFATALVNRLWSELVGEGFYEPVDDLGPDRQAQAPETLAYLATAFEENGYDVKWLFRTIMSTDAYQREARERRNPSDTPFAASCHQRLRGDQLFTALCNALGVSDQAVTMRGANGYQIRRGPRQQFDQVFGYDPSDRREDVAGTIPQALLLMNWAPIHASLVARPGSELGRLLAEVDSNRTVVNDLYLRTLARQPTDKEVDVCLAHVRSVGNRAEAFEDILWSLINSTEFLHRR